MNKVKRRLQKLDKDIDQFANWVHLKLQKRKFFQPKKKDEIDLAIEQVDREMAAEMKKEHIWMWVFMKVEAYLFWGGVVSFVLVLPIAMAINNDTLSLIARIMTSLTIGFAIAARMTERLRRRLPHSINLEWKKSMDQFVEGLLTDLEKQSPLRKLIEDAGRPVKSRRAD